MTICTYNARIGSIRREVGDVSANTHYAMDIDSCEFPTSRIRNFRTKQCSSAPASPVFILEAPASDHVGKKINDFYVNLGKFDI
ncbi:unnamed protein product [Heligmosomoides polygyrus]|uniref:ZP domain-containing protein n=1 Tax=Heligmosomoides polygyrus TaxID=6339 RepID=A0A183GV70_HELPZ|nr:unnamed protein product [Heligmosomoides polygyrus]